MVSGVLAWSIPCHFHHLPLRRRISLNCLGEGLMDDLEERENVVGLI